VSFARAGAPPSGGLIRNEIEKSEKLIGKEIKEENGGKGKCFLLFSFGLFFFSIDRLLNF
jgi:hypothetical protein